MSRPSFLGPPSPAIPRSLQRPDPRPRCYGVVAGGAAHVKTLAGAAYTLNKHAYVQGWAGTSAGALVSTALAFSLSESAMEKILIDMLQHNRILDFSPFAWGNYGLCRWEALREVVGKTWGKQTVMGEAHLPLAVVVTDLYTRRPRVFSSWATPKVRLNEVLPASAAIPFLAATQTIPSAGTGNRLYCDGGVADNFALDIFADKDERTVGLCLQRQVTDDVRPVRGLKDYVLAVAETALWESADVAARDDDRVISLVTTDSGFDFNQTPEQIKKGIESGRMQVSSALESRGIR
jgi:predicted acylesterase/phospholipase RssA